MEVGNVTDAYMTEDEGMRDEGSASPSKNAPVPSPRDGSPRKSPLQEDTAKTAFNLGSSSENGSASPPKAKMRKVIVPKESKERKSAEPPVKEEPKEEVTEVTIGDVGDVNEAEPTVSVTFTQPNTVKMAVETNGDGDHSEDVSAAELPPSGPLPSPDGKEEMEKVYTNLDAIEEAIASDEQYPMEGIDSMEERYKSYTKLNLFFRGGR
ncbi:unnamed protein product [Cylicostephanus goldi]|uniref:Uncharacterized protein n=1 Tax=Cylicostephanus goldi TaxID=71465 RepID=A0A3P7MHH2_CYLGO|nr:unnamed protein product [Cylicostephanus goldi]